MIINILGIAFLIFILFLLLFILPYVMHFQQHCCKNCGHRMDYKGLKKNEEGEYYLFYCPNCNKWEQIPKKVFIRRFFDKEYNPLENDV